MPPLFDHHCHLMLRPEAPVTPERFRMLFSECCDPGNAGHLGHSVLYRRGLRDLAAFLGCEATEEAVLAARDGSAEYARRLVEASGIPVMLVDTGLGGDECWTLEEQRGFLPCALHEIVRIESLAEALVLQQETFEGLEAAFRAAVEDLRGRGVVALKSIAAYRVGLDLDPRPSRDAAEWDWDGLKERSRTEGRARLAHRGLLQYLLRIALDAAARQELPVQFHVGLGDTDADLRTAGPLQLRRLLEDPTLRAVPFVLLHNWPYVREAGYLASVYSNVFVDLSLTLPFAAHGGTTAIREALEQAPLSKVLLATDACALPERFYLGALYLREALDRALGSLREEGWLTAAEVEDAAERLMYGNAERLYRVSLVP
jgi:predicted TIM-barrel fold metal-dependent hydrolase